MSEFLGLDHLDLLSATRERQRLLDKLLHDLAWVELDGNTLALDGRVELSTREAEIVRATIRARR